MSPATRQAIGEFAAFLALACTVFAIIYRLVTGPKQPEEEQPCCSPLSKSHRL